MILSGIRGRSGKSGKKWAPQFQKMLLITDLKKKKDSNNCKCKNKTLNAKQNEAYPTRCFSNANRSVSYLGG